MSTVEAEWWTWCPSGVTLARLPLAFPRPQIKRQQQEQLLKLKENPVKMMELLKSLGKVGRGAGAVVVHPVSYVGLSVGVCWGGACRMRWGRRDQHGSLTLSPSGCGWFAGLHGFDLAVG